MALFNRKARLGFSGNLMSEENNEHSPDPTVRKKEPKRKPFNPMVTYLYTAAAIFIVYSIFYIFGYRALIVSMLILTIYLFRETQFIMRRYSISFIRKAAYVNMGHAFLYFLLLTINGFWILQYGEVVLLREIPFLTQWAPVFVCLGVLGITNIKQMYVPDKQ